MKRNLAKATAATATRSTEVVMGADDSGEIRLHLEQLVVRFVVKGSVASDVIEIMLHELEAMRMAHEQDPDPAEDPTQVDEPAKDWPGAPE